MHAFERACVCRGTAKGAQQAPLAEQAPHPRRRCRSVTVVNFFDCVRRFLVGGLSRAEKPLES